MEYMQRSSKLINITMGACLLALGTKVSIPFSPVPFTLQTLMLGVNVLMFGSRTSLQATCLWVLTGCAGLPVFASGAGLMYLLGPSGGFILGFLLASYVISQRFTRLSIRYLIGLTIIYLTGSLWLLRLGFENVPAIVLSYMPGELMKLSAFLSLRLLMKRS